VVPGDTVCCSSVFVIPDRAVGHDQPSAIPSPNAPRGHARPYAQPSTPLAERPILADEGRHAALASTAMIAFVLSTMAISQGEMETRTKVLSYMQSCQFHLLAVKCPSLCEVMA